VAQLVRIARKARLGYDDFLYISQQARKKLGLRRGRKKTHALINAWNGTRLVHLKLTSDFGFNNCSQRPAFRCGWGKSSVIKQTLEMQIEDTSATRDPLKEACLATGVWVNSLSKAPPD
jgi:hypothetical protein